MIIVITPIYSVEVPEFYYEWMDVFDFVHIEWVRVLMPASCLASSYETELIIKAAMPLAFLLLVVFVHVLACVISHFAYGRAGPPRLVEGLISSLPHVLLVLFLCACSVSSAIFSAWACVGYEYSESETYYYLKAQPSMRCYESDEHNRLLAIAFVWLLIWPLGVPLLFAALLVPCRKPLTRRQPSRLSRAISFLHREYELDSFWWELIELIRKLFLTGFVLLIPERMAMVRLMLAIITCIYFLILTLSYQPFKQPNDDLIAVGAQVVLLCCFVGAGNVKTFADFAARTSLADTQKVMGFSSTNEIAAIMICFTFSLLLLVGGVTMYKVFNERKDMSVSDLTSHACTYQGNQIARTRELL